jgi:hypothetical protein
MKSIKIIKTHTLRSQSLSLRGFSILPHVFYTMQGVQKVIARLPEPLF